jgi:hypothetical protein
MELNQSAASRPGLPWRELSLLIAPIIVFWHGHFFFISDDWTALIHMTENPFWGYVNHSDAEQWFPVFHLVYYVMIKAFGEHYDTMLLVNCTGTGLISILVYRFLRVHLDGGLAYVFGLLYAVASVHSATVWHAYNICYILSFGFFMVALLLADRYLHAPPSPVLLTAIGFCAFLSIASHSFAILAISSLPLYVLLLGDEESRPKFVRMAVVIGIVYLCFAFGYFAFAGMGAAASHNKEIVSALPGLDYLVFWLHGAFIYPFSHLLGGILGQVTAIVIAVILLSVILTLTWLRGDRREKMLVAWTLLLNALPFLLVGLARYKINVFQAGAQRYGIFSMLGMLLLVGTGWRILTRTLPEHYGRRAVAALLLVLLFGGQVFGTASKREQYKVMSAETYDCYAGLDVDGNAPPLSNPRDPVCNISAIPGFLTRSRATAIKLFLRNQKGL